MAPPLPRELSGQALAEVEEDCADSRAFRREVIDRLRRHVDFTWFAWVLTDPETTVGIDPLAEIPDVGQVSLAIP